MIYKLIIKIYFFLFSTSTLFAIPSFFGNLKNDSVNYLIINQIEISGNKITKPEIIFRELVIKRNDTIETSNFKIKIKKSKENLLNTNLFNFVYIDTLISGNKVIIKITVQERWYFWPYPILEQSDRSFAAWLKQPDLSKIDYGLQFILYNFRGKAQTIMFTYINGYMKTFSLSWYNIYLDKSRKNSISFNGSFYHQNLLAFETQMNKLFYIKTPNQYLIKVQNFSIVFQNRIKHNIYNIFETKISTSSISDTIYKSNTSFFPDDKQDFNYFTFKYDFRWDTRNSRTYPLTGKYFSIMLLNTLPINTMNIKDNIFNLYLYLKNYLKLKNNWYFGNSIVYKQLFSKKYSYFLQKGFGYKETLRGFEYYVIDGTKSIINQNNLKFVLLPTKIINVNFISSSKFNKIHFTVYSNLFFDQGIVFDKSGIEILKNNTLVNKYLYSYGMGIDFVSYYDFVLRCEYSVNKLKEAGLFVNLKIPF